MGNLKKEGELLGISPWSQGTRWYENFLEKDLAGKNKREDEPELKLKTEGELRQTEEDLEFLINGPGSS